MSRIWNFSAGPAALPEEVLRQAQEELLDWHGAGCSVMEMSHRGKEFGSILGQAEADLRELMGIPEHYKVLFLQGGATQQFAQIPMNLLAGRSADYIVTGSWSKKAFKEAQRIGNVRCAATTESSGFTRLPVAEEIKLDPFAAYLHVCTNETIHGVEIPAERIADTGVPLVADMSSHILSRPVNVEKFGLIYAGAQKNIGPSGVTLVVVHRDLLGMAPLSIPTVMDYAVMAENGSMLNTPPTFGIYIAGLVFQWLKRQGGLSGIATVNAEKARILYSAIDDSEGFYTNPVDPDCRSAMNVPFILSNADLDAAFLAEAKAAGVLGLKGHKSVGGMRASIYNAVSLEAVQALVAFMNDFAKRNG
ncbi:MAG: 3-phosphoserine/phosphohydroxythreonine transaminase [Gammaproteobacteria bacterium]|nr:3-phosphoserine/phosphohydroxythreonine transaminase [Gammaproteobacteria bacterium]MBU1603036.1 3-phosphoserine/phosphohydroxythreonine transaminase [Gammaproteobacteria bacterium]MBU2432068.1 3-phosphoserine/phosphohydroxythreonine transaminase [Gammaproteobacteria bacterium]MBU2448041.1 3-phosphoserine/phosphohydroxythreonine transaminase [Gammaproteobacteria bacterium]